MADLRKLLKQVTDQEIPYLVLARVRERVNKLLYNCEPLDSPGFINRTGYELDEETQTVKFTETTDPITGVKTKTFTRDTSEETGITDAEWEKSKANWYYSCRLAATANVEDTEVADATSGTFNLPQIGSFVLLGFINSTDSVILMLSEVDEVLLKSGTQEYVIEVQKILDLTQKTATFKGSDVWKVETTTPDVNLTVSNIISMVNGKNEVSTLEGANGVQIAFRRDGVFNLLSVEGSAYAQPLIAISGEKFAIKNGDGVSLGTDILGLNGIQNYLLKLNAALTAISTQLIALKQPGIATQISDLGNAQTQYVNNLQKVFNS